MDHEVCRSSKKAFCLGNRLSEENDAGQADHSTYRYHAAISPPSIGTSILFTTWPNPSAMNTYAAALRGFRANAMFVHLMTAILRNLGMSRAITGY